MAGKREKPEDIVLKLRQVEVLQGQGKSVHKKSAEFSFELTSGPIIDQWRGWWTGTVNLKQSKAH